MRFLASKKNIQNLLYATLFLLPLHPYVFYVTLLPCLLLWAVNHCTTGEVKGVRPRLWGLPAVFLACAFFSGFHSPLCLPGRSHLRGRLWLHPVCECGRHGS